MDDNSVRHAGSYRPPLYQDVPGLAESMTQQVVVAIGKAIADGKTTFTTDGQQPKSKGRRKRRNRNDLAGK